MLPAVVRVACAGILAVRTGAAPGFVCLADLLDEGAGAHDPHLLAEGVGGDRSAGAGGSLLC